MSTNSVRQPPPHPRFSHPLMGANIRTLIRQFASHSPLPTRTLPFALTAIGSALARTPFSVAERAWVRARMGKADVPAPIFIIGHWRSGTTHLYNLLGKDPQFAFVSPLSTGLPWDFYLLGQALRPWLERALPKHRFIDRVKVTPDAPQEDEIALASMQVLSFYHGLYFPQHLEWWFDRGVFFDGASKRELMRWRRCLRYFYRKLSLMQPGRRLLIKNPVYSARIDELSRMWPDARFIHIHRNPYVVYQSTRNFYGKLLRELALQPWEQSRIDNLILSRYPRIMQRLLEDLADRPTNRAVEIRFESLEQEPRKTLYKVYRTLEISGFEEAWPRIAAYLADLGCYRKNLYTFPVSDNDRVTSRWRRFIDQWGYTASPMTNRK